MPETAKGHPDQDKESVRNGLLITIDGPAGVGKSTVSRSLAKRLGYAFLNTGILYRALAWKMRKQCYDPHNPEHIESLLSTTDLRLNSQVEGIAIQIDGKVVDSGVLKTPEISQLASTIAVLPRIRAWLLPVQRELGEGAGVVAEGRDMGTRVFPQADVKFFLEADLAVRAKRRLLELANNGQEHSLQSVQDELAERDVRDRTREIDPLSPAQDAVMIDTSDRSVDQVVDQMMEVIADRL